ncbi:MAG: hypothetical protein QW478_07200 [Candidatus Micrarchaeaceae archaeon]
MTKAEGYSAYAYDNHEKRVSEKTTRTAQNRELLEKYAEEKARKAEHGSEFQPA